MRESIAVFETNTNAAIHHVLFDQLVLSCEPREAFPVAVCWPCSDVSLSGVMEAAEARIIFPLFVGPKRELSAIATSLDLDLRSYEMIP